MQKKNEQGLTLVEILASITILSILIGAVFSLFPRSYFFAKVNQSKTVAIHIGRGVMHYIEKQDYDLLNGYRAALGDSAVAVLDAKTDCSEPKLVLTPTGQAVTTPLFADETICAKILAPTINNNTYGSENIQVFLMPFGWSDGQAAAVMQHIRATHANADFANTEQALQQFQRQYAADSQAAYPLLPVLVYIDLYTTDDREGLLLEGSVAHEAIR